MKHERENHVATERRRFQQRDLKMQRPEYAMYLAYLRNRRINRSHYSRVMMRIQMRPERYPGARLCRVSQALCCILNKLACFE